jgi:hypothetical protein
MTQLNLKFKLDPRALRHVGKTIDANGHPRAADNSAEVPLGGFRKASSEPLRDPHRGYERAEAARLSSLAKLEGEIAGLETDLHMRLNENGQAKLEHQYVQECINRGEEEQRVLPNPYAALTVLWGDAIGVMLIVAAFHAIALLNRVALDVYVQLVIYSILLLSFFVGCLYTSMQVGHQDFYGKAKSGPIFWSWFTLAGAVALDVTLGYQSYALSVKLAPFQEVSRWVLLLPCIAATLHIVVRKYAIDYGHGKASHAHVFGWVKSSVPAYKRMVTLKAELDVVKSNRKSGG